MTDRERDIRTWLQHGIKQGWCSSMFCWMHDAPEPTDEEHELMMSGTLDDPCMFAVRIYDIEP
jgi:hypothetical protein